MSVKRYDLEYDPNYGYEPSTKSMHEYEHGEYVLYTDYSSLLERCERMEKALETINRWGNDKEPEYALHVVDIVRISAEALAAKEEGNV